jgi:nucleoside diphosphate kinase
MTEAIVIDDIPRSEVLTRERLSNINYRELELSELEQIKLQRIVKVLEHPRLQELIDEGKITHAMVKPRADWNTQDLSDLEAAEAVRKSIKKPLEVVFDISVIFEEEDVEEFYAGGPREVQESRSPIVHKDKFRSRWDELVDIMTSGPTTIFLLYDPSGNAIPEWRDQIGHWDVDNRPRQPGTIRGDFAKSNYTSIVHGSDSLQNVKREVAFLSNHLKELLEQK